MLKLSYKNSRVKNLMHFQGEVVHLFLQKTRRLEANLLLINHYICRCDYVEKESHLLFLYSDIFDLHNVYFIFFLCRFTIKWSIKSVQLNYLLNKNFFILLLNINSEDEFLMWSVKLFQLYIAKQEKPLSPDILKFIWCI